jgi:hypothetical protein
MRTRTATLLAAALLTLTACSSSDDAPSTDPTDAPPAASESSPAAAPSSNEAAELTAAVAAYTASYFAGDADTAYGLLSARCAKEITPEAYSAVVDQAATEYGPDHMATDVTAKVSGEMARVSYKVSGLPKFDQTQQPWALEGGKWKYDAC